MVSLEVKVWPKLAVLVEGNNVTFLCSYRMSMFYSISAEVSIKWMYNQDSINDSKATFIFAENLLHLSDLDDKDRKATITCVVSVIGVSNQSEGVVEIGYDRLCVPTRIQRDAVEVQQHASAELIIIKKNLYIMCIDA